MGTLDLVLKRKWYDMITKKDLLEAITDMPMDMPIKVEVCSQGLAYAFTPIVRCEIIGEWLIFIAM